VPYKKRRPTWRGRLRSRWFKALRGSIGQALASIENGFVQIEEADLSRLTGSEVKVLTAIVSHMKQIVGQLESDIARLYLSQDN
jgi:hypothetical protein